jgi:hypothetical protein
MRFRRWAVLGVVVLALVGAGWGVAFHYASQTPRSSLTNVSPELVARAAAEQKAVADAARRAAATRRADDAARLRTPVALTEWPPKREWSDADEREVGELIAAMASSDFAAREAAGQKLRGLGPRVVPALRRHLDYDDPEVTSRVRSMVEEFGWMNRGAVVVRFTDDSPAQELGVQPGDVIVKVNGTPVLGVATISEATPDQPRDLSVWRAGEIRTIKVPAGMMGVFLADWDAARGGNDHARGLAVLSRVGRTDGTDADADEAYARLRRAREAGVTERWTMALLAGLAAQRLDHAYAMDCYRAFHAGGEVPCSWTHHDVNLMLGHLPFDGPHSAALLERYRTEPWSPGLYHQLIDWSGRHGRNYPMLTRVIGTTPSGPAAPGEYRWYETEARVKIAVNERRWADALRDYDGSEQIRDADRRHLWGIVAAIHAGRIDKAVDIAARALQCAPSGPYTWQFAPDAWPAIEAAGAAGDAAGVGRLTELVRALPPDIRDHFAQSFEQAAWTNVGAAEHTLPLYAELAGQKGAGRIRAAYFALLGACPTTTADAFQKAWDGRPADEEDLTLKSAASAAFLRFGLYDDAESLWAELPGAIKKAGGAANDISAVSRVVEFARRNGSRLQTDWAELRGLIQVLPGLEANTTWVLRWDGAVIFVDADGKLHHYPGLPKPPAPLKASGQYLWVDRQTKSVTCEFPYPGLVGFTRRGVVTPSPLYVLDPATSRWVNTYETDCGVRPTSPSWPASPAAARAAVMRYVNQTYPTPAGQVSRRYAEVFGAGSTFHFEGDLQVAADPRELAITDYSAEVAKVAGLDRPARVYDVGLTPMTPMTLVLTEVGLFAETRSGNLRRVELPGLKNPNVHVCWLDPQLYPRRGRLLGVAPQDGGQVYEIDAEGVATPTPGYCGQGPADWFAEQFGSVMRPRPAVGDAIQRLYLQRIKADR